MSKTAKLENEDKLFKKALEVGCKMAAMQGYPIHDPSASQSMKARALLSLFSGSSPNRPAARR